ncbi:hypothetical protein [Albidovulum sp.]
MIWLFVLAASVLACEVILRLPLVEQLRKLSGTARKSSHVLSSRRISDHWKERVLPRYAWTIGRGSVILFALICLALAPVAALGLVYPGGLAAWGEALMRPAVIAALCVVSLLYIWLRGKVARRV